MRNLRSKFFLCFLVVRITALYNELIPLDFRFIIMYNEIYNNQSWLERYNATAGVVFIAFNMNIMLIMNNKYYAVSFTMLASLIHNNCRPMTFYVFTDDLKDSYRKSLSDFINANKCSVHYIDVDVTMFNGLSSTEQYPPLLYCNDTASLSSKRRRKNIVFRFGFDN